MTFSEYLEKNGLTTAWIASLPSNRREGEVIKAWLRYTDGQRTGPVYCFREGFRISQEIMVWQHLAQDARAARPF